MLGRIGVWENVHLLASDIFHLGAGQFVRVCLREWHTIKFKEMVRSGVMDNGHSPAHQQS